MFSVQCINHNVEAVLDLSDNMPKLVRGDSARVVQIFANLISNSIKFTSSGHIILRGWCENFNAYEDAVMFPPDQKKMRCALGPILRQQGSHMKKACKKANKVMLWFEIDDTGCGIDPSKWESVFESFEQADPSTTRLHGGTGLGLCIVRTLVCKMGGEIKIVKKNGPGTLIQLSLLLTTPLDGGELHSQLHLGGHNFLVLLALYGGMGRAIMSEWLRKHGLSSIEASEWNELTQIVCEIFDTRSNRGFDGPKFLNEPLESEVLRVQQTRNRVIVIVIDIGLLDLTTDIWKEQLNFLDKFSGKAKFAWMLNHDTSNAIKTELRRKGHMLMVNEPLYKAKMIQILETLLKEKNLEQQKKGFNEARAAKKDRDALECVEIDSTQFDAASSEGSDAAEMGHSGFPVSSHNVEESATIPSQQQAFKNCLIELTNVHSEENNTMREATSQECLPETEDEKSSPVQNKQASFSAQPLSGRSASTRQHLESNCHKEPGTCHSSTSAKSQKALGGLRILLAEDNPVLQRVAAIMLEKMGATVTAVGDGLQVVDALNCTLIAKEHRTGSFSEGNTNAETRIQKPAPYDLILMDCQMPKMDGYEATKAIRKSETGSGLHIPIVALTAHAMSSDEAKCLEVGMDAYLTKPIDYNLMVSTILSLTKS